MSLPQILGDSPGSGFCSSSSRSLTCLGGGVENGFAVLVSAFSLELFCERSPALRADVVFFAFNFLLQTNFGLAAQITNNH